MSNMLADYHMHTQFSDDSVEPMENMVKKAIALNFDEICFSDHVDYGIKLDVEQFNKQEDAQSMLVRRLCNVDYPKYMQSIKDMRTKYRDVINIKTGMEFGVQKHTIPQFETLFFNYDFDFIIMSCHQVEDKEFWTNEFQEGQSQETYIERYYQEIYDCVCAYKNYSVLGHLDMIQRYTKPRYPFEKSKAIITKILKQVIQDGKGIEVNSSSFHYKIPDLMPERAILKLYYELGGKIITVGSDAHETKYLGDEIPYIYEELKKIGFTHVCTFDRMIPSYHAL